jgi:predicted nucleotidyltransferase
LTELIPGQKVIIFGSLARPGVFNDRSDVDLALESEPEQMSAERLTSELMERLERPVNVVLLDHCRFRDKILRQGEVWTLKTLQEQMRHDSRTMSDAFQKALARYEMRNEAGYESCAHQLSRLYNAFEQSGLRVAKAFENNIDDEKGLHGALLSRLTLAIAGIRPALIPESLKMPLSELRGFRHIFVHAYDLRLDPEKLALVLKYGRNVSEEFPVLVEKFVRDVATEQEIDI